jgi:hypothetical protein
LSTGRNASVVATTAGSYVAWTDGADVFLRRPTAQTERIAEGAFPAVAALPDGSVLLAWEARGAIVLRNLQ